jgi:tyrosinase
MKHSNFSRRHFLKNIGIVGGFSLLGSAAAAQTQLKWLLKKRCQDAGAIIRKSFKTLTAAELTAFKNGVAVMKSRGANDPTSWTYQAAIHGTVTTPVQTAWNTCQHNTTFFLSWHRMYICFFERILRKASGLPSLGLPYWNYSEATDPNARFLPAAFRSPANSSNPLYDPTRNAAINAGTAQLAASAVSLASVLPGPTGFYPFSSNINGTPHGNVHIGIGGDMTQFATAGLDPIFWLHHCNIDRLWNRWLAGGGGRSNPPASDTTWQNTNFTFFDEFGVPVQMKGSDLVTISCFCRSCYDEEAEFVIWEPLSLSSQFVDIAIGVYRKPTVLEAKPLRFVIDLNDKAKELFARVPQAAKPENELNFELNFEGVKADKPVDFFYEVYLDLPENAAEPNYKMESYAGNLSLFGADHQHSTEHGEKEPLKFGVNVTDAVKRLKNLGAAQTISVTLVPAGLVSKDEKRLPIRSDAKVSVEQITLSAQERKQ